MMTGIRTLQDIRDRCRIDEETGCWIWAMATSWSQKANCSRKKLPVCYYGPKGRNMSVIRLVVELRSGRPVPSSYRVWRTCGDEKCCNPAHLKSGTHAAWGNWWANSGRAKFTPDHKAAVRVSAARRGHLTPAQARQVILSDRPGAELAREYGVSQQVISRIRRGITKYGQPAMGSVWALAA
jgi:hypothetical protein